MYASLDTNVSATKLLLQITRTVLSIIWVCVLMEMADKYSISIIHTFVTTSQFKGVPDAIAYVAKK